LVHFHDLGVDSGLECLDDEAVDILWWIPKSEVNESTAGAPFYKTLKPKGSQLVLKATADILRRQFFVLILFNS
jgi:hypothetical protein